MILILAACLLFSAFEAAGEIFSCDPLASTASCELAYQNYQLRAQLRDAEMQRRFDRANDLMAAGRLDEARGILYDLNAELIDRTAELLAWAEAVGDRASAARHRAELDELRRRAINLGSPLPSRSR